MMRLASQDEESVTLFRLRECDRRAFYGLEFKREKRAIRQSDEEVGAAVPSLSVKCVNVGVFVSVYGPLPSISS